MIKAERGISFEEVLVAMSQGALLDVIEHPDKDKYPNQRILIVRIRGYASEPPIVSIVPDFFEKELRTLLKAGLLQETVKGLIVFL